MKSFNPPPLKVAIRANRSDWKPGLPPPISSLLMQPLHFSLPCLGHSQGLLACPLPGIPTHARTPVQWRVIIPFSTQKVFWHVAPIWVYSSAIIYVLGKGMIHFDVSNLAGQASGFRLNQCGGSTGSNSQTRRASAVSDTRLLNDPKRGRDEWACLGDDCIQVVGQAKHFFLGEILCGYPWKGCAMLDGVFNAPLQPLTVPPQLGLLGFRRERRKIQLQREDECHNNSTLARQSSQTDNKHRIPIQDAHVQNQYMD